MIRDAEIEQLLRDYTAPIFKAAGLTTQNVQVVIINDPDFNAFVMDAHRIFVNTGALMQSTTPNQMIGVFAHECGHIVGGHLSKMRQELANVQTAVIVGMLLGAGALAAGAHSGNIDMGNVGGALLNAPQAMGMSTLLAYQRAQEESADRAGVRFLTMTASIGQGHVRHLQALRRPVVVLGVRLQSLLAEPSGARGAHGRPRDIGEIVALLERERLARAAIPP